MNATSAELYFGCHLEGAPGDDARIQKALKFAAKDEKLTAKLAAQTVFDANFTRAIRAIPPPAGLAQKVAAHAPVAGRHPFNWRSAVKQPPFFAVLFGLLFLAGWGIYVAWNQYQSFPGKETAAQLVEINEHMTGLEMEIKAAELGTLGDWLFSKYGFETFYVPGPLASLKTIGGRVFKKDGFPVAQVAVEKNHMICYMFRGDDLGIKVAPDDEWRVFIVGEWSAAIQQHGDACFMIAFRGNRASMSTFLAGLP